jgi:hypothetical protein
VMRHATEVPRSNGTPATAPPDAIGEDDDEDGHDELADAGFDLTVDQEGVAAEWVVRWRAWRWWLYGIAALTLAAALVFGKVWMVLGFYALAPALLWEVYLAVNALEAATAATWLTLHPLERALARAWAALLGLGMLAGVLGMLGWIVYLAFYYPSHFHFRPQDVGVALLWVYAGGAGLIFASRMGWMAVRRVPPPANQPQA